MEQNYPDTAGTELTDGQYGEVRFGDPAWQAFLRQGGRSIQIDLGQVQTVQEVKGRFLHVHAAGLYVPRYVDFSFSVDGQEWAYMGRVETQVGPWNRRDQIEVIALGNLRHLARWVRLEFPTDVNVFMDEIEVLGYQGRAQGARDLVLGDNRNFWEISALLGPDRLPERGFLPGGAEAAAGAQHIALLVYAYPPQPQDGVWSSFDYLPYVTYISSEATAIDWMFDTVLLCPQSATPSGKKLYATQASEAATIEEWRWYVQETFRPRQQVPALNQAVGRAKEMLDDPDHTMKVILTLVNPSPLQHRFGALEDGGENLSFDWTRVGAEESMENRVKAVQWLIDQFLTAWEAENTENLELIGFYWQPESIGFHQAPGDDEFVRRVAGLVHERGLRFFWIPFYGAAGSYDWHLYGFDVAILQPNYMFSDVGTERIALTAQIAQTLGMGVEMEKHWTDTNKEREKWLNYLNGGVEFGYMNSVVGYYQGFKDFGRASMSFSTRPLYYEAVYRFIQGEYRSE